jgi:RNA polymerase sigma factor (sigma-70 family)
LLHCFIAHREESAFATLMQRHGRLVWGVCRHVLRHVQDAEDAFQATFLVLARRASSIRKGESVGSWLHGVAYRVAVRLRRAAARREARERTAAPSAVTTSTDLALRELQAVLDEEVQRLPEKYRSPFVLCCLEGRGRKEAADELGWKEGTVSSRVAEARRLLRQRLARRGVALSAALCAVAIGGGTASAAVPAALADATARAAVGQGGVAGHVLALTERMVRAMLITRWKVTAAVVLVLALAGLGVGLVAAGAPAAKPAAPRQAARADEPPKDAPKAGPKEADLLKQAAEAAQSIDDPTHKVWVLLSVAEAQARAKDKDASAKTFADALQAAKEVTAYDKWHRFIDVAEAQAKAGDVKGAKETADLIEDNLGNRDSALARIAIAQVRAGDLKGAEETIASVSTDPWKGEALRTLAAAQAGAGKLKEAAKTAAGITDDLSRVVALLSIARAHRAAKDDKAAAELIREARKEVEGIEENEKTDTRAVADGALAEGLAEAGDAKEARKLAGAIKKEMWRAGALWRVVKAQAGAGDVKGALETAKTIEDEPYQESAIQEVLTAQVRAGDLKGALKTFEGLKRPFWRAEALIEIAKAQAKSGDGAAAGKSFEKAFAEAKGVEEKEGVFGNAANACHAHIARAMAETGREKEAAAWAAEQTVPLLKAQALICVAEGMALRRETQKGGGEKKE